MLLEYFHTTLQQFAGPDILWLLISFAAAITVSRLIHHAFFTPLARIPGPFLSKFSNLPLKYKLFNGEYHAYIAKLHSKYGEVVRIGYDHVSLSNTSDTRLVLATHAFRKGEMYSDAEQLGFVLNTFSTATPGVNKIRRRQIGDAFSSHTIRANESMIVGSGTGALIRKWDSEISKHGTVARVNYFNSLHCMVYDAIGEFLFDTKFDTLRTGDMSIINMIRRAIELSFQTSYIPMTMRIPWLLREQKLAAINSMQLVRETIKARQKYIDDTGAPPRIDILQKFIDARDPKTGEKLTAEELESEIITMLLASSDTTGLVLTSAITNLMHYPECYRQVTDEVRSAFPDASQTISFADAKSKLPYLSAVIHETMRLNPSFSTILQRTVPAEGITFQDFFIPGDARIGVSIYACHRNPRLWQNPDMFNPERFLGDDSHSKLKDILLFSSGVRVCPGRNLSVLEIYTVLANILRRYDFALPEDAPYGPHRLDSTGIPIEIPTETYGVASPKRPDIHCWVNISLATSA